LENKAQSPPTPKHNTVSNDYHSCSTPKQQSQIQQYKHQQLQQDNKLQQPSNQKHHNINNTNHQTPHPHFSPAKASSSTDKGVKHEYNYLKLCVELHMDPFGEDTVVRLQQYENSNYFIKKSLPDKQCEALTSHGMPVASHFTYFVTGHLLRYTQCQGNSPRNPLFPPSLPHNRRPKKEPYTHNPTPQEHPKAWGG
jgi:hypothetical protein